ncbi:protein CHROMATIN REMODELING 4 [Quillaja saponaria]|uniref:Protein CHROMATIN REMODELING 4 n=1 Tax=Quillaja saponaria TaxID=32244 RepID=A0AAD7PBC8_QUISA|nr:protein CHROMATIN REMODELING 4 [Quillaja saponaria]
MANEKIDGRLVYKRKFPFGENISKDKKAISSSTECKNSKRDGHLDIPRRTIGNDGYYYECMLCDEGGNLLCCDTCPATYHLECLSPPLESVPEGNWQCQNCSNGDDIPRSTGLRFKIPMSKKMVSPRKEKNVLPSSSNTNTKKIEKFSTDNNVGLRPSSSNEINKEEIDVVCKLDSGYTPAGKALKEKYDRAGLDSLRSSSSLSYGTTMKGLKFSELLAEVEYHAMVKTWTGDQLDALWTGVRRYGQNNWEAILQDPSLNVLKNKTAQDLSMRWREEVFTLTTRDEFPPPKLTSTLCSAHLRETERPDCSSGLIHLVPSLEVGSFGLTSNNSSWLQKPNLMAMRPQASKTTAVATTSRRSVPAAAPQWPSTSNLEHVVPEIGHHQTNKMMAMRSQVSKTTVVATTSRRVFSSNLSSSTSAGPRLLMGGRFQLPNVRMHQNTRDDSSETESDPYLAGRQEESEVSSERTESG